MCSLCWLPIAKDHYLGQNFDIWETPVPTPFTDEGQIWHARADPRSTLTRQISSQCVHCVSFWWPKNTIWANFDLWGAPVPTPFYLWGPSFSYTHSCITTGISRFKAHDDHGALWWSYGILVQFSSVISHCNITFLVFWLSQGVAM